MAEDTADRLNNHINEPDGHIGLLAERAGVMQQLQQIVMDDDVAAGTWSVGMIEARAELLKGNCIRKLMLREKQ